MQIPPGSSGTASRQPHQGGCPHASQSPHHHPCLEGSGGPQPKPQAWFCLRGTAQHRQCSSTRAAPVCNWDQMRRESHAPPIGGVEGFVRTSVKGKGGQSRKRTEITCKSTINFSSPIKPVSEEHWLHWNLRGGEPVSMVTGALFHKVLAAPTAPPHTHTRWHTRTRPRMVNHSPGCGRAVPPLWKQAGSGERCRAVTDANGSNRDLTKVTYC